MLHEVNTRDGVMADIELAVVSAELEKGGPAGFNLRPVEWLAELAGAVGRLTKAAATQDRRRWRSALIEAGAIAVAAVTQLDTAAEDHRRNQQKEQS